jgi:ribosome biogenesis GTPase A
MSSPAIHWYPGHIAKAERDLLDNLKKVDVVLEVRDARIPLATHHPRLQEWIGGKARILVLNRVDMITPALQQQWIYWFQRQDERPIFTNAQHGQGIQAVAAAAIAAGTAMNARRRQRGMQPRAVRAVVIGFPNVGKSALINRLVNKRVVDSARRAGVTRQLRWVRLGQDLDLLDAPGVLPARLADQQAAIHLALCDDIGEASYDNQRVCCALIDRLKVLQAIPTSSVAPQVLCDRYGIDEAEGSGEDFVDKLSLTKYQGDRERTARQILNDFRKGVLGPLPLELPPI